MLKKHYLLGSIALFFLSGCTGLPLDTKITDQYETEIQDHVITIGKDGELRAPLTGDKIAQGGQEAYLNNIVNRIRAYIEEKKSNGKNAKLVLFIHGGLAHEAGALKRALETYPLIKASGKYPVFINWNSEGIRSYGSHLIRIRQGDISPWAKLTAPFYLLTDIGNTLITAPKAWLVSGGHMLNSTFLQEYDSLSYCNNGNRLNIRCTKDNADYWNVRRKLKWIITSPSKVVTTPFAYTLGKPAWDIMLRRTNTLFYTPSDLELKANAVQYAPKYGAPGSGALYQFLAKLEEKIQSNQYSPTLGVEIIGHSMGAIVVNKIINQGFNLPYKNIVHMGAADSIENLFNLVIPYLSKNKEVQFYSLALHPKNEDREASASGLTPSGSLLTWIDNQYTVPETVMSKRSGRWDNMARAIDLIPNDPDHIKRNMHFTIFGIQGRKECTKEELKSLKIKGLEKFPKKTLYCTAEEHGDFDELPFWLPEVWKGAHLPAQGD